MVHNQSRKYTQLILMISGNHFLFLLIHKRHPNEASNLFSSKQSQNFVKAYLSILSITIKFRDFWIFILIYKNYGSYIY
jgi:hypothetical protein